MEEGRNNKYAYILNVENDLTDETKCILKDYRNCFKRYSDYDLFGLF